MWGKNSRRLTDSATLLWSVRDSLDKLGTFRTPLVTGAWACFGCFRCLFSHLVQFWSKLSLTSDVKLGLGHDTCEKMVASKYLTVWLHFAPSCPPFCAEKSLHPTPRHF